MVSSVVYDGESALDLILEDELEVMIPDLKIPGIDGKVNISIRGSNNGFGISEKDLKRIFEPFFTTKTNKGGTRLGLPLTYGLVQEIGSSINVSSQNGKGRDFTENPFQIELPIEKILSSFAHVPTGKMAHER